MKYLDVNIVLKYLHAVATHDFNDKLVKKITFLMLLCCKEVSHIFLLRGLGPIGPHRYFRHHAPENIPQPQKQGFKITTRLLN